VPRYFFNFDDRQSGLADLIGRDLPDDEAAKSEAMKLAADVGIDKAIVGELPIYDWIEVLDEAQRPIARLRVTDALKEPNRRS
jgi:hypothetical protein